MVRDALFYKDNYMKEFTAIVKDCFEDKGKIKVVLDNTAFYPEGGGQPSDIGFIDDVKVIHVEEKENTIYHIVESKIEIGKKVNCKIDFDERFQNMQGHTAEHIVSGMICKKYNTSNVGFHMGKDFITLDFNIDMTESDFRELEKRANEAIYKNLKVNINVYSNEEAKNMEYRSKLDLKEDVRIVEIPGYDKCACCGVHVTTTGEIGLIKLVKFEHYKQGIRIYMLAGVKALEYYDLIYKEVNNISTKLSKKIEEVDLGVDNLLNEIDTLKKEKSELKNRLYELEINNLEVKDNLIVVNNDLTGNDLKSFCTKLLTKVNSIAGVVSQNRFILMSNNVNLKEELDKIKQEVNIKGGGNNVMVQGQILGDESSIEKFVKLLQK